MEAAPMALHAATTNKSFENYKGWHRPALIF
jgi:hypothetical protein